MYVPAVSLFLIIFTISPLLSPIKIATGSFSNILGNCDYFMLLFRNMLLLLEDCFLLGIRQENVLGYQLMFHDVEHKILFLQQLNPILLISLLGLLGKLII